MNKIVCAPEGYGFEASQPDDLEVLLYGRTHGVGRGSVGATIRKAIQRRKLHPAPLAWDLLSIALSVVAADVGVRRKESPDGWTRQFDLHVAVSDPVFWTVSVKS